ncbi:replication initiation protein, partial [Staphylococcus epidermidis]|uniref:replication initiation protein n=1 Tax=Staphylococcus epidermidis TaxID=1282 RepID=UPI00119FDCFC
MSEQTVVYQNQINLLPLPNFTTTQIHIFFTLSNNLKQQHIKQLPIPFHHLPHLTNYYHPSLKPFLKHLQHLYHNILTLTYTQPTPLSFKKFLFFTPYQLHLHQQKLILTINPKLNHLLNQITPHFTNFQLKQITHLKST